MPSGEKRPWRWWVRGLIWAVGCLAIAITAGVIHTELILKGQLTPEQDEALSGKYGQAAGIAAVAAFALAYALGPRKTG